MLSSTLQHYFPKCTVATGIGGCIFLLQLVARQQIMPKGGIEPHTRVVTQGLTPHRDQIVTVFWGRDQLPCETALLAHGNNYLSSGVPFFHISDCLRNFTQRVLPIYDRYDFPGFSHNIIPIQKFINNSLRNRYSVMTLNISGSFRLGMGGIFSG